MFSQLFDYCVQVQFGLRDGTHHCLELGVPWSVLSTLKTEPSVWLPPPRVPHNRSQIALCSLLSFQFWGQMCLQLDVLHDSMDPRRH